MLTTTRQVEPAGLGAKASIEWSDQDRWKKGLGSAKEEVKALRELWAGLANEHLKERTPQVRIDHRSLEAQGVDRVPGTHLGVVVCELERRGIETRVGLRVREQQRQGLSADSSARRGFGRLERERRTVNASILDLSGDLAASRREFEQRSRAETADEVQRTASGSIGESLEAAGHGGAEASPLFRPLHNSRDQQSAQAITPDGVYRMVREYSKELGFEIGAHSLRATAATNALDHQADIA